MNFNLTPEKLEEFRKLSEQYKAKAVSKTAPKVAPKVIARAAPKVAPKAVIPKVAPKAVIPKVAPKAVIPRVAPKVAPKALAPKVAPKSAPKAVIPRVAPKVAPKVIPRAVIPKVAPKSAPKAVAPRVAPKANPASELWKELHLRALKNKGENETAFLTQFSNKIPRYTTGCKCREFWVNYVRTNPPKYGPNGEFFEWTTNGHNAVNKKLSKPTYTVEQARKFYQN